MITAFFWLSLALITAYGLYAWLENKRDEQEYYKWIERELEYERKRKHGDH